MDRRKLRLAVQGAVKSAGRKLGLEIRYAFQNPPITSAGIYAPWIAPRDVKCIFDVGANTGQSARAFVQEFPAATIHSFEPFPAPFERLDRLAQRSGGRIHAHRCACGQADQVIDVQVTPGSTSQLNQIPREAVALRTNDENGSGSLEQIRIRSLDNLCGEQGITKIDILKTDTEGHDAQVLLGASDMLRRRRVCCIVTEIGFFEDTQHTSFTEVLHLLDERDFELVGFYETSYTPDLKCDFSNALFVCRNLVSSNARQRSQERLR